MQRYSFTLTGTTPVIFHSDNIAFSEIVRAWQKDPANKQLSTAGDDRTPAWTWIGYCYFDGKYLSLSSDNLMTCIREGGAKVDTGKTKGDKSFKRLASSGIIIDTPNIDFYVNGKQLLKSDFDALIHENDFVKHIKFAEDHGFELLVKRAKVMMAKHVRVRPLFRNWVAKGTLTVLDEEKFGLKKDILDLIFEQAGMLLGVGDWRPGSPKAPGYFGKFSTELKKIK